TPQPYQSIRTAETAVTTAAAASAGTAPSSWGRSIGTAKCIARPPSAQRAMPTAIPATTAPTGRATMRERSRVAVTARSQGSREEEAGDAVARAGRRQEDDGVADPHDVVPARDRHGVAVQDRREQRAPRQGE